MRRHVTAMKAHTQNARRAFLFAALAGLTIVAVAQAAETRKDAKIDVASGGSLNIVSGGGSVTLHSGNGHQVLVSYTVHSDKIEVDQNASSDKQRVGLRT